MLQDTRKYIWILLLLAMVYESDCQTVSFSGQPILYKKIELPSSLLQVQDTLIYGGDLRVGDLQHKGNMDILIYRAANSVDGGAVQPCFLAALDLEGNILWQKGSGGQQPNRPGPVAIHDIDGDGAAEVICLFAPDTTLVKPFSMQATWLQILDGKTGVVKHQRLVPELTTARGKGPNWVHQRILIANLTGNDCPQDFILKLGKTIFAFDHQLNLLWTYFNPNAKYRNCPAYIPAVGDMDGDGLDEINGGYYLLNHKGEELWAKKLGKNMDSVAIDYWDNDEQKRAFCSGFGFVMDERGDTILRLGETAIPHGQELRVADFLTAQPGLELAIRYNGHHSEVKLIDRNGIIRYDFNLNDSPNHTGMEAIYWNGSEKVALLYNGGTLWSGEGELLHRFEELNAHPKGNKRQGWYHCIPADITGDSGEEVILYNPWEASIFVYAAHRAGWNEAKTYMSTARQYNVRLMD